VRAVTQHFHVSGCSIGIIPLDYGQSGCADYVVLQEFDVGKCCVSVNVLVFCVGMLCCCVPYKQFLWLFLLFSDKAKWSDFRRCGRMYRWCCESIHSVALSGEVDFRWHRWVYCCHV